jgi:hypothetical protein
MAPMQSPHLMPGRGPAPDFLPGKTQKLLRSRRWAMQLYAVKHASPALCRLAMNATVAGPKVCSSSTTSDRRSVRGRSNTTTTSTGSTSASSSHTPDSASSSSIRSSVPLLSWVWLHHCLGRMIRAEWTRHSRLLCVLAGAQGRYGWGRHGCGTL